MDATSTVTHFWLDIRTYQIALEYLRVLVWPGTGLFIVLYFRAELRDLLNRMKAFKYKDFEIHAPTQGSPTDDVPQNVQEEIKRTIEDKKEEIQMKEKLPDSPTMEQLQSQVATLLTQIATVQSAFLFERIYNLIFGSQIATLDNLRKQGGNGMWHIGLTSWYEGFRANDSVLKNYPFGDYMGFLIQANLIKTVEAHGDRRYVITDLGTDFLNYIEKSGYSKFKPH